MKQTQQKHAETLKQHIAWRRDDDGVIPMVSRESLGAAMDAAIDALSNPTATATDTEDFGALISLVREWGESKEIIGVAGRATLDSQFGKLVEEIDEIRAAIAAKNQFELIDGIGDSAVVLILLADLAGVRFEDCLRAAYGVISKRTGKMVNGTFVKDCS